VYAIFGRDLLVVRIIQALIGSASCVLLGLACARLFSKRVGLIAGLALALWAPAIFFDSLLQKAVLDMFFMCLSLWLIARLVSEPVASGFSRTTWIGLGASLAALALTRENGMLLIGVIAIWALLSRQPKGLIGFALGLALVFTPVVIRNYSIDGGFYLTTSQF